MKNFKDLPAPFLRRDIWEKYRISLKIPLDLDVHPHSILLGATGSGKTTAIKSLVGHILTAPAYKGTKLIVCDYKGLDYDFLSEYNHYFSHDMYGKGLETFRKILNMRIRKEDMDETPILLVIDEWNNFITNLSRKEADEFIRQFAYCLNMSRAYHMYIVAGVQTAHAEWFGKSRDSFSNIIGLGQLSKEAISMMYSDYKEEIKPCPRGCGYLLQDGLPLQSIKVCKIRDFRKLEHVLIDGISR